MSLHRQSVLAVSLLIFSTVIGSHRSCLAGDSALPAFPGAVGQGAAAVGGRGGDVYHVVNLADFNPDKGEPAIPGSLRDGVLSANGPRTIVFDVGGGIKLHRPLTINKKNLTIAGQTAPGGISVWAYPLSVARSSDIIVRHLRSRPGDFNVRAPADSGLHGRGNQDLDGDKANAIDVISSERVILDHVSTAWGMDETLSVTHSRDITVQNSVIAQALDHSFHLKGNHGYGSLVRGEITPEDQARGVGGYTFYGNLWAMNRARNPSIGGEQTIKSSQSESERRRADVNLVNNVIYGWGDRPTHRNDFGDVHINLVGNYYVNGPANKSPFVFFEHNPAVSIVYQDGNMLDANLNHELDGKLVGTASDIEDTFRGFDAKDQLIGPPQGKPLNFFAPIAKYVVPAPQAYARVLESAGASLTRDAIDRRIRDLVVNRTGVPIDSQEIYRDAKGTLAGIDDLRTVYRATGFDSDHDGMPDTFEAEHQLDPHNPADGNRTNLSKDGYTNLEVYLDGLTHNPAGQ